MVDRPIVYVQPSFREPRQKRRVGGQGRGGRLPDHIRQRQRLGPRITELEQYLARGETQLSESAAGVVPEEVVVFDIAGSVDDFVRAVRRIEGMEWLVESDEFDSESDEDFGPIDPLGDKYSSRLYLILANQQALRQLLALWQEYQEIEEGTGDRWPRGRAAWGRVFGSLKDLRLWGAEDRLRDTGLIEEWQALRELGMDQFPLEIDLWFRDNVNRRMEVEETIGRIVERVDGEVLSSHAMPEIGYHGILARLRAEDADRVLNREEVELLLSGHVMLLRPAGQFAVTPLPRQTSGDSFVPAAGLPLAGIPRVALLDGAPLSQHSLLEGRVIVSDPDGFDDHYGPGERKHGTAMSSAIIHGDLSAEELPLTSPLLVRPIMQPNPSSLDREERMPADRLAVDLVHSAVHEILDEEASGGPVAPSVRVINLSICIPSRPLEQVMSPMGRLLDWLSWRYKVLFVVSAGNHADEMILDMPRDEFSELPNDDKSRAAIVALWNTARIRRILSPADSINGITVASTHEDGFQGAGFRREALFETEVFPSPLNPLGPGFGRSVKPDVLAPGGRQPYRLSAAATDSGMGVLRAIPEGQPPGILVADGGSDIGLLDSVSYTRGTSNAAAAVTRLGAKVIDVLKSGDLPLDDEFLAVATKCLIGHSAAWGASEGIIADAITPDGNRRERRLASSYFWGFGKISEERAVTATDQRFTAVGWDYLAKDETHTYEFPLPPIMSGQRMKKRLVLTLAWFTPISSTDRRYRKAKLWVEPIEGTEKLLGVSRAQVDHHMVRRGTLQHECFEGASAAAFIDGEALRLRVSCREDAGGLRDSTIGYALAVSLEAAGEMQLNLMNPVNLYDEMLVRLKTAVRVGVGE